MNSGLIFIKRAVLIPAIFLLSIKPMLEKQYKPPISTITQSPIEKTISLPDSIQNCKNSIQTLKDSTQKNKYAIKINLPEFKSRLYENNIQIDSSVICPGGYSRRSPVLKTKQDLISIRPSFNPTPAEAHQFKPNPPDRTQIPGKPRNALGRFRLVLSYTLRMHGTSLVSSISKLDSSGNVKDGQFRSNGCLRHDNEAGERLISKIIKGSQINKISGRFKDSLNVLISRLKSDSLNPQDFVSKTPKGLMHNITLENPIEIEVSYRLWDKKIIQTDSSFIFTIHRDIYNYSNGRSTKSKAPFDETLEENAYLITHLKRDFSKLGIYNISDRQIRDLYKHLQKELKSNKESSKKIELIFNSSPIVRE